MSVGVSGRRSKGLWWVFATTAAAAAVFGTSHRIRGGVAAFSRSPARQFFKTTRSGAVGHVSRLPSDCSATQTPLPLHMTHQSLLLRGGANDSHKGSSSGGGTSLSMSSAAASAASNTAKGLWGLVARLWKEFGALSRVQKVLTMGIFVVGYAVGRLSMQNPWTRYKSVLDIPTSRFGPQAPPLVGVAASVSDGDTIRFLHVPTPFHSTSLSKGQKLSEEALPIRICTLDTPETAKFGKKGQPFGQEAKQRLSELVDGKKIQVRLLQKDQYARGVAEVAVLPAVPLMPLQYVDEVLLREGLAEVYQGGGAVYGPKGLNAYLEMEAKAREEKRGIWSLKNRESAAEYKKRTKE